MEFSKASRATVESIVYLYKTESGISKTRNTHNALSQEGVGGVARGEGQLIKLLLGYKHDKRYVTYNN